MQDVSVRWDYLNIYLIYDYIQKDKVELFQGTHATVERILEKFKETFTIFHCTTLDY